MRALSSNNCIKSFAIAHWDAQKARAFYAGRYVLLGCPNMEIVDKEKWEEYKQGYRLESLLILPIYLPCMLAAKGYWYLALVIVLFSIYLYHNSQAFKIAREILSKFGLIYFSCISLMFATGVLTWLYPDNDKVTSMAMLSLLVVSVFSYFSVVRKVKAYIFARENMKSFNDSSTTT